jgi:hypothetical protein
MAMYLVAMVTCTVPGAGDVADDEPAGTRGDDVGLQPAQPPGSPSRLRFQSLHRFHGLCPDSERLGTPLPHLPFCWAHENGSLNVSRDRSQPPGHLFPDHARRVTRDYCLAGHVRGYDAACGHYCAIADDHAGQDYRSGADPHAVTEDDGLRARARYFVHHEFVGVAVEYVGVPGNRTIRADYKVIIADDRRIEIYI